MHAGLLPTKVSPAKRKLRGTCQWLTALAIPPSSPSPHLGINPLPLHLPSM
ncbi:hypothetical protein HYDPIDRAFT_109148, partial [Hydnomerulius pinastri MD-312]